MSDVVIDASAALSFFLPSQSSRAADEFLSALDDDSFIAPDIIIWEVGNALIRLRARGVAPPEGELSLSSLLSDLDLSLQPPLSLDDVVRLAGLASREGLRLFDAAYLALAVENNCALASRDARLLEVARLFVPTYDLLGARLS